MGKVVPYRSPTAEEQWTASIGMIVFLGSWGMMFGALFFAYGIIRASSRFWPPPEMPAFPLVLPAFNTACIIASSFALHRALRAIKAQNTRQCGLALAVAATLGTVFLTLQTVVWFQLYDEGLAPHTGAYASVFYALTCFHALHVLVGLGALARLAWNAFRGRYNAARYLPIKLWTMYWHFVGAVWGVMYLVLYLL